MKTIEVLGTPLTETSYEEFTDYCHELSREPRAHAVDLSNTQVVTMRRHDPEFQKITSQFDFFLPDGMPLIWCMNSRGAKLRDRVYGPKFMRHCLLRSPDAFTHYLLGGSEECGQQLRERFSSSRFVGAFHGKCNREGILEDSAERQVIEEINRLSPDFIWVGLGTPKQDAWIYRHKSEIKRGVICAVGFAFDVNAGSKQDAPEWMQRHGVTWLFRILSEPRRLLGRYLKYNTLFLFYLCSEKFRSHPTRPS
jgi:N-acetylglucosaminyldiphosphoundecaprenol N-acetyl-beta-D-mannosaminyltransferase